MEASITILTTKANDPDQFEAMPLEERRQRSAGWKVFPLRSGRFLDTFLMKATDSDFGVFASAERPVDADGVALQSNVIMKTTVPKILPALIAMVEQQPDKTAEALAMHGGAHANVGRIREALTSGTWPTSGDPAEETAAFAFHLLAFARIADLARYGLCLEYRGQVTV